MAEANDIESKIIKLNKKSKEQARDGDINGAKLTIQKILELIPGSKKHLERLKKLQEYLDNEENEDEFAEIGNGFLIHKDILQKLYTYQVEGVKWFWNLYKIKKGGILGDDMGLGKTIQVISFLSGMFDMQKIKTVFIILPVSLVINWEKEFNNWAPGITVLKYEGSKKARYKNLSKVQKRSGVLIITYGLLVTSVELLAEFVWDYVILDEGHKIKNPTRTTKAVYEIPAYNRFVLTGTPIQNNLREIWSLFDFVHQGTLLGSLKTFQMEFESCITRSREKCATSAQKRLGIQMAEVLRKKIEPYFLRRTKADVLEKVGDANKENDIKMPSLKVSKTDLIIWVKLSPNQIALYRSFLESDQVKQVFMTTRSPLIELNVLKKICDHPRLLKKKGLYGVDDDRVGEVLKNINSDLQENICQNVSVESLIEDSGKLAFLVKLVENLCNEGHRCLIFSLSLKILDIIQKILENSFKIQRIDGTIVKEERASRIRKFQRDPSFKVFLLTTQVGGVGLTLTAADRVIIYDPSWNPATDAQAVDRAYRIGQEKPVIIYRLMTCGTVEEKIYRRQIFKSSINVQVLGKDSDPYRYFTRQDIRELFSLKSTEISETHIQLESIHKKRVRETDVEKHCEFLLTCGIFGISDHNLMFSEKNSDVNEGDVAEQQYIQKMIDTANLKVNMENMLIQQKIDSSDHNQGQNIRLVPQELGMRVKNKKLVKPNQLKTIDIDKYSENAIINLESSIANMSIAEISDEDEDDNYMSAANETGLVGAYEVPGSSVATAIPIDECDSPNKTSISQDAINYKISTPISKNRMSHNQFPIIPENYEDDNDGDVNFNMSVEMGMPIEKISFIVNEGTKEKHEEQFSFTSYADCESSSKKSSSSRTYRSSVSRSRIDSEQIFASDSESETENNSTQDLVAEVNDSFSENDGSLNNMNIEDSLVEIISESF